METPLSQTEIADLGNPPGPDSFPAKFFKKFSTLLSPFLTTVLTESLKQGSLPPSMNEARIVLIAKKGKDPAHYASYMSISLLNTDAKIFAKTLAHRLDDVTPSIITQDQTGFIKNRHSFFNV